MKKIAAAIVLLLVLGLGVWFYWTQSHPASSHSAKSTAGGFGEEKIELFLKKEQENPKAENSEEKKKYFKEFLNSAAVQNEFSMLEANLKEQHQRIESLPLPEEQKGALLGAIKKIFDVDAIQESYMERLYSEFSADELRELNEVYEDEAVKQSLAEIQRLQTSEGRKEFNDFVTNLAQNPISDERKKQYADLDQATGMSRNAGILMGALMGAMQPQQSNEDRKAMSEMMNAKTREISMLNIAMALRNFDSAKVNDVIKMRSNLAAQKEGTMRIENLQANLASEKAQEGFREILNMQEPQQ